MDFNNQTIRPLHWLEKGFFSLILMLLAIGSVQAQAPMMKEQMVYKLRLFNGKDYQDSFCPPAEDTLYLIADTHNVFHPKMTLIYYWPITRRYMAGFKTLNETVNGILEIVQGGKVVQELQPRTYTFFLAKGWYAGMSEIILDKKAKEQYEEYQQAVKNYTDQLKTYHDKKQVYQKEMNDFFARTREQQKLGMNSTQNVRIPIPQEPPFPRAPEFYVQEPGEAFVINLPAGRYEIRLRASDGVLIEGSEKRLVSFTHRRSGKIGYEVISAKRWTMPETSSDSAEVIYFVGKNTLFYRPYIQTEYNHLYYSKLLDPQNDGYPELWRWVNIKQIEKGSLQLFKGRQLIASIEEKPYYVQQIPGPELGYTIIDYEEKKFPGRAPSLVGYRVELQPERGEYHIQVVDATGTIVPGSMRGLRVVEVGKTWKLYLASVVLPLAACIPIFIWRKWKLR